MNDKRTNELMEKEPELKTEGLLLEKELKNIRKNMNRKDFEKNNWLDKKFQLWDLSGGLLGI